MTGTGHPAVADAAFASSSDPATLSKPLNFGPGLRGKLRAASSFLAVLTAVLIVMIFFFSLYRANLDDPDIWWHIRDANYLLAHHQFLRADLFSFTVAGHPWIDHEWLAEISFYLAFRALGLAGVSSLTFILLTALFLLLLYLCFKQSHNFKSAVFVCYYAAVLATVSFGPRTILFGYLDLAILLIILDRFQRTGTGPLWAIPILFCLWANTHGSWSMGIIIFFLITASGLISGSWGRVDSVAWTPRQLRGLIAAGLASVLALFVNPYGWRLVYYPFDMAFHQKLNIAHVQEWISVDFHDLRGKMALILIFGAILGALLRNRRWNLGELLVLLFALYCGLTYSRFLVLLGLVSAPILAKQLDFFPPYRPKEDTPKLNVMVLLLLFGFMVYFWPREAKIRRSMEKTYPAGVVSYLEAHPPTGNVLNFYLWGGYLGWHDPSFKVFIDSRMDIFEYAGVLKDYLDLMGADSEQHRPDPILAKYNIQYVLFPPSDSKNPLHTGGELVYVLQHDSHWKEVYQDPVSVLLMKR